MFGTPRRLFVNLLIVGVAAVVLACGGSSNSGSSGATSGSSGDSGNSAAAASADLRLPGSDPITLDPALASDADSATYIVEIFSGLVTLDQKLNVVPDLAEAIPDPVANPDGTVTYVFKIRADAKFQDGRPVTADDFKYSLDRAATLGQTTSVTADAYLGDIVGAKDVTHGRAQSISGVKVVDQHTLSITIDGPKPYFMAKLTYPTAFVVDRQQVEANPRNWTRKPNGTGPYKLSEWRLNERIILEANDSYVGGAPSVKRVLFVLSGGSSLTQYENGELDVSGIGLDDIERVQSPRDPLNAEYKTAPELSIGYIGFNTKTAPFDDPKVRQAFAMSIDRDQIAKVAGKNMEPVANSIMMPGLPGYNKDAQALPFDVDKAKQLLSESKYKDAAGLGTITLTEVGGGASASFATQAIVEMWKQNLGVDVQISQSEAATFYDDLDSGRLQMYDIGWIIDYPDPEDIIDLLFYSKSRQDYSGYSNPDVDNLILAARVEQDPTKRLQDYQQAEKIILQDAPWIPLFFGQQHIVVKPYVKGYDPTPIVIEHLRNVSIQK